ncbi:MAG: poly-gamma-glutamate synthase PgsB [Myxococcota bacterium]
MGELGILLSIVMGLTCVGAAEKWLHTRRLLRIPHRIHVNGTRGKSSVTRLIAAGLRNAGVRTLAKTTGTLPRLILPSSREIPIYRRGRPNVLEQLRVVATACTQGVDALVVECMALQPQLQWLCESKIVRSTHGVITNIRPDHLDVMGPDESDVARALAGTVPIGGSFVSAETKYRDFLSDVAHDRGTQITWVSPTVFRRLIPKF